MTDREDLLRQLVVHGHLNMADRHALGIVKRQEVKALLKSLLSIHGAFPFCLEGKVVYEGATLYRDPTGIQIIWRRAYPWDPFTVAESRTETFPDIDAAIEKFIESEWRSGIDGISLG
jgi:hypothetical protein